MLKKRTIHAKEKNVNEIIYAYSAIKGNSVIYL